MPLTTAHLTPCSQPTCPSHHTFFLSPVIYLISWIHHNECVLSLCTPCSQLCTRVEALEVEDVALDELLLHLVEFVAADCVDVATLELLLEDLRDRDLTQVSAHA